MFFIVNICFNIFIVVLQCIIQVTTLLKVAILCLEHHQGDTPRAEHEPSQREWASEASRSTGCDRNIATMIPL